MDAFKGKRIVITGVSRGIGYQAAKLFLQAGGEVFGTARDAARLAAVAADFKPLGPFTVFAADLSEASAPKRVAEAAGRQWGAVDILVNNAAVQTWRKSWMAEGVDMLEANLRVNLFAPHALIFHLLPLLRNGDDPRIINVSSGAGAFKALSEGTDMPSYRMSKYALNGLSVLWARELAGQVAVNSLDPGWLRTDMGGPEAPGEPVEGGRRVLAAAGLPFETTGKFLYGDKEIEF